VLRLRT